VCSAAIVVALVTGGAPAAGAPAAGAPAAGGGTGASGGGTGASGGGTAGTAGAPQSQKDAVDAALGALQDDLVGTSEELTAAYAEYAAAQEQLPGAQRAATLAEQVQAQAQAQAADLANRLASSRAALDSTAQTVRDAEESIEGSRAAVGRLAAKAYRNGTTPQILAITLGAQDTDDLASRSMATEALADAEGQLLADAQTNRAVRAGATQRLDAVTTQIAELQREADDQLEVAEQAAAEAQRRRVEAEAIADRQRSAVATIESRQAEEQARLDQLQRESDSLGDQLREIGAADQARADAEAAARAQQEQGAQGDRSASSATQSQNRGSGSAAGRDNGATLRRPDGRITSPFGMRLHPIRKVMRLHSGQDFASGCGNPIRAAEDGEIVSAGYNGGYGNIIVVNHGLINGDSVATAYPHLSGFAKTSGPVSRGEVIGYEGTTGSSTGCHLHFEVRVNGSAVDPMGWI